MLGTAFWAARPNVTCLPRAYCILSFIFFSLLGLGLRSGQACMEGMPRAGDG